MLNYFRFLINNVSSTVVVKMYTLFCVIIIKFTKKINNRSRMENYRLDVVKCDYETAYYIVKSLEHLYIHFVTRTILRFNIIRENKKKITR